MKPEPTKERLDATPFTAARICRSCAVRFPAAVAVAIAIDITENTPVEKKKEKILGRRNEKGKGNKQFELHFVKER